MNNAFDTIRKEIINDPTNIQFKKLGYEPLFIVDKEAKIVIIGQAPGKKICKIWKYLLVYKPRYSKKA